MLFKFVSFHLMIWSTLMLTARNALFYFMYIRKWKKKKPGEGERERERNNKALCTTNVWTYFIRNFNIWCIWFNNGNTLYICVSYWFDENSRIFACFTGSTSTFSSIHINVIYWMHFLVVVVVVADVSGYICQLF